MKKKTVSESSGFSGISLSSTRSSLSLNIENKGTRDELDATTVTQRGSHVSVGGDLTISSGETATVMGSDVVAGDIDIEGESVHIVSAEASQAIMETHAKTKDTVSLTVGNAWVETAYSAIDAADAVIDAVQAGESMDTSTKEGRINKAAADAQAAASAVTLANSVAQSAGSVATAGFYGAVSATHEETSETTSTTATQARGAQLVSLNGSTTWMRPMTFALKAVL